MMTKELLEWLSDFFEISKQQLKNDIVVKYVAGFLILWTIFEQKSFSGSLNYDKIKKFSGKNHNKNNDKINMISYSFHTRYQCKNKYKNLIYKEKEKAEIKTILEKDFINVLKEEKLLLCLYVLYRYSVYDKQPSWIEVMVILLALE
jgi:hypothetical protein